MLSGRGHGLPPELLAWLSTWFDFGELTVERVEGQGALGTRDRCCRDVRLALDAATTYARDQGLHEVASRMSRYGSHALFRALPRILEGWERIAWELTGATATRWNTTYSYICRRGPLSAARYRELCANLSSELAMREGEARRCLFAPSPHAN
jgi:hypothetical protein